MVYGRKKEKERQEIGFVKERHRERVMRKGNRRFQKERWRKGLREKKKEEKTDRKLK